MSNNNPAKRIVDGEGGSLPAGPAKASFTPTLSNTVADPNGPFSAIEVFATGTLTFVDLLGNNDTRTVASVPYTLLCGVQRIKVTGTDISAANMRGLVQ